jgi:hypothetical protein
MSRRTSLPGAEELFRTTGSEQAVEAPAHDRAEAPPSGLPLRAVSDPAPVRYTSAARRSERAGERGPSGRERHDEKITVYVSAGELLDLEQARLTLRGEHGMVVDRGRIVREALAVVLADLDANKDASILVRRLGGR